MVRTLSFLAPTAMATVVTNAQMVTTECTVPQGGRCHWVYCPRGLCPILDIYKHFVLRKLRPSCLYPDLQVVSSILQGAPCARSPPGPGQGIPDRSETHLSLGFSDLFHSSTSVGGDFTEVEVGVGEGGVYSEFSYEGLTCRAPCEGVGSLVKCRRGEYRFFDGGGAFTLPSRIVPFNKTF